MNKSITVYIPSLTFLSEADRSEFYSNSTDPRLRAFVYSCTEAFPDNDWVVTGTRRKKGLRKSGHSHSVLSAVDLRSKTWTEKQLVEFWRWFLYWWGDKPDMVDVVIEDGRFDKKYLDYKGGYHIHCEIDSPYWKRLTGSSA